MLDSRKMRRIRLKRYVITLVFALLLFGCFSLYLMMENLAVVNWHEPSNDIDLVCFILNSLFLSF